MGATKADFDATVLFTQPDPNLWQWDKIRAGTKSLASQLFLIVEQDAVLEDSNMQFQLLQPYSTVRVVRQIEFIKLPISVPLSLFMVRW